MDNALCVMLGAFNLAGWIMGQFGLWLDTIEFDFIQQKAGGQILGLKKRKLS
jgi:hypothetical protein